MPVTQVEKVSKLKREYVLWRIGVPIQSMSQLVWAVLILTTAYVVSGSLLGFTDKQMIVFVIATVGVLPAYWLVLPASFKIYWRTEYYEVRGSVQTAVEAAGWKLEAHSPQKDVFVQRVPKILRWQEGTISVKYGVNCACFLGPQWGLWLVRNKFLPKVSQQSVA